MTSISIKKAALTYAAAKYSTIITNLIFTAILARLLTPHDYGIVAVVFVFSAFFGILSDMGLGSAVIQNKDLSREDISAIFSFSVRGAVILAVGFCLLSVPISILFKDEVYIPICCILSIAVFASTLNIVPNALLLKDKKFFSIGIRMIVANLLSGGIAVLLAIGDAKYYALVFQTIVSALITFFWNYMSTKPKFLFKYEKDSINKIKSYGGYQFIYNLLNYFARNLDNILIGKFLGTSPLAFYSQAYNLMIFPLNYFTYIIMSVMHPILSDYQSDKAYIYKEYVKIVKILSLAGVFITTLCFISSKEIILLIYGSQWENSIECFRILSISIFFQMTAVSSVSIYLSLGNTRVLLKSGVVFTAVMAICILIGISNGNINFVALFVTIGFVIRFFTDYYYLFKVGFEYSVIKFYAIFVPDALILLALIFIASYFENFAPASLLLSLLYKFGICFFAYVILLLSSGQYKHILVLLPSRKSKKSDVS